MPKETLNPKKIKTLYEMKLVGFRVLCDGGKYLDEIPNSAQLLKERVNEVKYVMNMGQQIGAFVVEESTPDGDGYWICVQVGKYGEIPEGMVALTIPAQSYASIMHHGPNDQIRNSYEELHRWISGQGLTRLNQGWNLEIYGKGNDPANHGDVTVELLDSIVLLE